MGKNLSRSMTQTIVRIEVTQQSVPPAGAAVLAGSLFGMLGAVVMGMPHGMFCIGCCAAVMLLLFAVAATDLRWVVALTVLVTSEKLLPGAKIWRLTIAVGFIAAAAGLVLLGWKAA
jgi:predicted metal-binding membrane protein